MQSEVVLQLLTPTEWGFENLPFRTNNFYFFITQNCLISCLEQAVPRIQCIFISNLFP